MGTIYFVKPYLLGWESLDLGASVGSRGGPEDSLMVFVGLVVPVEHIL